MLWKCFGGGGLWRCFKEMGGGLRQLVEVLCRLGGGVLLELVGSVVEIWWSVVEVGWRFCEVGR